MPKNVLYIGRFFSPNNLKRISEDTEGNIGYSNHNFEMSLIKGLVSHAEINLNILTLPGFYSYPQHSKTFYVKGEHYEVNKVPITSVGFCNFLIYNKISSIVHLLISILKYYRRNNQADIYYIIINTPKLPLLLASFFSKLFTYKKVSITMVVPDIPSMITSFNSGSSIKKYIVGIEDFFSMYLSSKCDYFVFLTDEMKKFFKKPIKYIVVEGLIDESLYKNKFHEKGNKNKNFVILYTGTLNRFFGITRLLDAFDLLQRNDVELWICGSGDTRLEIEKRERKNPNIKYFGLVDIVETKKLQMEADILVNPRGSEGEFTKYSFPSKTIEYLITGNIVISYRLPGIPSEYYNYIICPKEENSQSLADTINIVLNMNEKERMQIGIMGREFVMTQKNTYFQTSKILNMIFDTNK